jgi:lysophospholipase L1-like esterase
VLFHAAASEPNALQEYKRKMAAYLDANDVPLLDFSYDPRLPEEYFADVLHMNETGKAAFTQLLADALKTVIEAGQ